MIVVLTLLACGDKSNDTASTDEPSTEDTSTMEDTSTGDTNTDTDSVTGPLRPFCKMLTALGEYNGEQVFDTTYTWEGLRQTDGNNWTDYNEYGMPLESYSIDEYGWETRSTMTYDCDRWCKMLTSHTVQGTVGEDPTQDVVTTYVWDGNTQSTQDGNRYWTYNDMGYLIEFYDSGDGWSNQTTYEYSCNDTWCQTLSYVTVTSIDGLNPTESSQTYQWTGNTQTWDVGSSTYNEFGYLLETETSESLSQSLYQYTYSCDE